MTQPKRGKSLKAQRNACITAAPRCGLDSVGKYVIVIFLVGEIGDARDQAQILREVLIRYKIKNLVGRNVRFRNLRGANIRVLPELL